MGSRLLLSESLAALQVATPTSVLLMAINTVVGYIFREFYYDYITFEAREFLYACMPVVRLPAAPHSPSRPPPPSLLH